MEQQPSHPRWARYQRNGLALGWPTYCKGAYPWKQTQGAAGELGITLRSLAVREPKDIEAAFAVMAQDRPDALIFLREALTLQHRKEIIDFTIQKRVPGMFVAKEWTTVRLHPPVTNETGQVAS